MSHRFAIAPLLLGTLLAITPPAHSQDIRAGFVNPPMSARPQVWWHWLAGNVSKDGITADLEAMKQAGIGGGTIANISFNDEGPAPFMTPQWRDMVKHAVSEAARLGLEIGAFNCEGWSSSGGPWVTPDIAMQMLVWSESRVTSAGTIVLPQPLTRLGYYRDVAVLAFPTPESEKVRPLIDLHPKITGTGGVSLDAGVLTDGNPATYAVVPETQDRKSYVQIELDRPFAATGLRLMPGPDWARDDVVLQVSDDGQTFRTVRSFPMPLSFLETGTDWYAGGSFPAVTARFFRLCFDNGHTHWTQPEVRRMTVADIALIPATDRAAGSIAPTSIVNLTGKMDASGQLAWAPSAGDWTVVRFGYTPIGKHNHPVTKWGEGLECDKFSRDALRKHFAGMMDKVIADAGPLAGKTFQYGLIDSYECGEQNWTADMPVQFRRLRGYDVLPWLPVLTGRQVESADVSRRFSDDFRRTVADLWNINYYGYFGELMHAHHMKSSVEAYGNGTFDTLRSAGLNDMPMSEFWFGNPDDGGCAKQAAAAAHTYGRKIVGAESFTSGTGWNFDPWSMKIQGDGIYVAGVNRYYFHSYAQQMWADDRKPGWVWGNGINLTRNLTWWNQASAWFRYLARCQYLLQQGRFVADILSFSGDDGYSFAGDGRIFRNPPAGYDFDGIDRDLLLSALKVENGQLVLPSGMRYRVLALPNETAMSPATIRHIRDLVRAGAVVFGPKPTRAFGLSGYPASDAEVQTIAEKMWGPINGTDVIEHRYGKGRVFWTGVQKNLQPVLTALHIAPDCAIAAADARLRFHHRRIGSTDAYFIANQELVPVTATCTFRVSGKAPEIWDSETGKMQTAPVWSALTDGRTTVPIAFEPGQSVFVVFARPASRADHLVALAHQTPTGGPLKVHTLEIRKATYVAQDGFGTQVDLTAKVAAQVHQGAARVLVTNDFAGGDPAPLHVKEMRIDFVYDGEAGHIVAPENGMLRLPIATAESEPPASRITTDRSGIPVLTPWEPGIYTARYASGRTVRRVVPSGPQESQIAGAWTVRFSTRWGGPTEVVFDKLVDWTKRPEDGIRFYSGTARYEKTFDVPTRWIAAGRSVTLDLGMLRNLAEVSVNGHRLGVIWKPPWRADVTGLLRPGKNTLQVSITNQWSNRLIGDARLPEKERIARTTLNPYGPDSPLQESGLLGPVTLRSVLRVPLR